MLLLSMTCCFCSAQKKGAVWCFGDSALVDFSNTSSITTGTSMVKSRGSCASISDSSGSLLFYSSYDPTGMIAGTDPVKAYNFNHVVIMNGDSMKGGGWYHEIVIIPYPGSDSLYYLFYIGVTLDYGLWYSIIDMTANGGSGAVIQKNIQLQSFQMVDCLTAIKHGNGRDWWIIFRRWNSSPAAPNNEYHSYLVTPAGIINYTVQHVGSIQSTGFGNLVFNQSGNEFIYTNPQGLMEKCDFDRCTGIISNPKTIYPEQTFPFSRYFWGGQYSSSDSIFYTTTIPLYVQDTSRLLQFDLTAANIVSSTDTLWETPFMKTMGQLKLAADGKIYLANNYLQVYPYSDTTYNIFNMNLSVINSPDSLGASCNLQPYSFYLGGKRTYVGLPNNPDYHLGPKIGSGCDTLTALNEHSQNLIISNLSPNPNNGEFTVNYFLPNGKSGELEVFNLTGQRIFYQRLPRYTYMQYIELKNQSEGIYLLKISGGGKVAVRKFVVSK